MVTISYFGWMLVTLPQTAEITPGENFKEFMVRLLKENNIDVDEFMFEHLLCKNGERMLDDTVLYDGDKITIFPPSTMG